VLAHRVETELLGLQCGIQDQLCSAYGAFALLTCSSIRMHRCPGSRSRTACGGTGTAPVLVYLGVCVHPANSTAGLSSVWKRPAARMPRSRSSAVRTCGKAGALRRDLDAMGRAMIDNNEAQGELHPALVSADARCVVELARSHGAAGGR